MQTKDQAKRARDWKVIGSVVAVSALGLSGLALADSNGSRETQQNINLTDPAPIINESMRPTLSENLRQILGDGSGQPDLDSPFGDISVESVASPVSPDSPASPASVESPASPESADSPTSPESPASPDSVDSPASPESDDSADDGSADS